MSVTIKITDVNWRAAERAVKEAGYFVQKVGQLPTGDRISVITTDEDGGFHVGSVYPTGSFGGAEVTLNSGRMSALAMGKIVADLAKNPV